MKTFLKILCSIFLVLSFTYNAECHQKVETGIHLIFRVNSGESEMKIVNAFKERFYIFGITDLFLQRIGDEGKEWCLQSPVLNDNSKFKEFFSQEGRIEFREIIDGPFETNEIALKGLGKNQKNNSDIIRARSTIFEHGYFSIKRKIIIKNEDIKKALVEKIDQDEFRVRIDIAKSSLQKVNSELQRIIGKKLAIVLDNTIFLIAQFNELSDKGTYFLGRYTRPEAASIAYGLNSRPPFNLSITFLERNDISPIISKINFPNGGSIVYLNLSYPNKLEQLKKELKIKDAQLIEIQKIINSKNDFLMIFRNLSNITGNLKNKIVKETISGLLSPDDYDEINKGKIDLNNSSEKEIIEFFKAKGISKEISREYAGLLMAFLRSHPSIVSLKNILDNIEQKDLKLVLLNSAFISSVKILAAITIWPNKYF